LRRIKMNKKVQDVIEKFGIVDEGDIVDYDDLEESEVTWEELLK